MGQEAFGQQASSRVEGTCLAHCLHCETFSGLFPATGMLSAAKWSVTGEIQRPALSAAAITKKVLVIALFQSIFRFTVKNYLIALP